MIEIKGDVPKLAWIAVVIALAISFVVDLANVAQGGSIDLRNRITGTRLMQAGIDPYHYKWTMGKPQEYADVFNNPKLPVSKTTATPALLMLHVPLSALTYIWAQYCWIFLQWLMLLGAGWLWWLKCEWPRQKLLIALAVTGLSYTDAWRLHAERGQAYVLLALLLAAWMALTYARKSSFAMTCLAGAIAGFLIALRPTFMVLLPFLALHQRRQFAGVAVGLLLGIGLPLLMHSQSWSEYAKAMQENSAIYRDNFAPRPGPQHYPKEIEGVPTDVVANFVAIPYADFSVQALLHAVDVVSFPAWPVLLVWAVPCLVWLALSRGQPLERLLAALAAWIFIADFFLPAYRNTYNDVMFLDVVAPVLALATRFPLMAWPAAAAVPVGWGVYAFSPEAVWIIHLPTLLLTVSAMMVMFAVPLGSRQRPAERQ